MPSTSTTSSRSPTSTGARTLASRTTRRRFGRLAASMMKVSQNQYAEMLLRWRIGGRAQSGAGRAEELGCLPTTATSSPMDPGLSRYNYVTSEALVRILQGMRDGPEACIGVRRLASGRRSRRHRCRDGCGNAGGRQGESKDRNRRQRSRDCRLRRDRRRRDARLLDHREQLHVPTSVIDAAADKALDPRSPRSPGSLSRLRNHKSPVLARQRRLHDHRRDAPSDTPL